MLGRERSTRWSVAILAAGLVLVTIGLFPTDCLAMKQIVECLVGETCPPGVVKSRCLSMSGIEWRRSSENGAQLMGIGAVAVIDVLLIAIFVLWRRAQEKKQPASP